MKKLLIANRGEIAIRVTEAAELGFHTVAIFSEDDAKSLHVVRADEACPLRGVGAAAYLDGEQIVAVVQQAGCEAMHKLSGFAGISECLPGQQDGLRGSLTKRRMSAQRGRILVQGNGG